MKRKKFPKEKNFTDVWIFITAAIIISLSLNWLKEFRNITVLMPLAPLSIGILTFLFQRFVSQKPLIELYSKAYPYRKLKPYGVISAFILFEFVLIWGLHTKQLLLVDEDMILITIVLVGVIIYYHLFVRMKISLRFLFLAIFIPLLSVGTALGIGSYIKILKFVKPATDIGHLVFFNTAYWILVHAFIGTACEEPAFRGYIMQRFLNKGELKAILYSAAAYALWRIPFSIFIEGVYWDEILLLLCGNLMMGIIFALLFVKGKNLLIAITSHGIMDGLYKSFFASEIFPGISQYIKFTASHGEYQLTVLWFFCLFIGLILLTFVPRKKIYAR